MPKAQVNRDHAVHPENSATEITDAGHQIPALAAEENILDRLEERLHDCIIPTEMGHAKLLFLAMSSRILGRPMSVVIKGQSGSGKSYLLNTVAKLFPADAYVRLSGMSEKALVYLDTNLRHKMLFVQEYSGLGGDGMRFLRQLLSEDRIEYAVATPQPDGPHRTETISREGPTGLVMATTEPLLHPEDESRVLSINVDDSPERTQEVLKSMVHSRQAKAAVECWVEWVGLQSWLAEQDTAVFFPHLSKLSLLLPTNTVRITRGFQLAISAIYTHALLHRKTREVVDGSVVATLDDYAAVRALIADVLSEASENAVPKQVRETVNAVADISDRKNSGSATCRDVAQLLGINASTASRRIKKALGLRYLTNLEHRPSQEMKLILDEPMPEDVQVLPTAGELEMAMQEN